MEWVWVMVLMVGFISSAGRLLVGWAMEDAIVIRAWLWNGCVKKA